LPFWLATISLTPSDKMNDVHHANAIVPPPPGHDIVSLTPGRRRRGKNVERRRGQQGQVFQKGWCHGRKWNPEASAYLRYLADVPGQEERKLKCVTLGKFRTLTLAEQAARVYMQVNGVNDRHAQEQSIMSLTFGQQADKFLTASIDPARRGGLSHGQPTTFGGEQSILG